MTDKRVLERYGAVLLGFVLAAFGSPERAAAQTNTYSVFDLGVLADVVNETNSQVNAINNFGDVAGINVTGGNYRAVLYRGAWRNLGTLGGTRSGALGVNDAGQVVGWSRTTNGILKRAFLWTDGATNGVPANPAMQDLGALGGNESEATAINASGQITGFAQTPAEEHAFLLTGTNMLDVGALITGLPYSYASGINDAGNVVGLAYDLSFYPAHAFFYNGTSVVNDIVPLGGQTKEAYATAINNSNQITGYIVKNSGHYAFRHDGTVTELGTLGGNYSYGLDINNAGVIVGGSFTDAADTNYNAFVTVGNTMVNLNSRLDSSGAGWTLIEARAINDLGQIVGKGRLAGVSRSFLLNPVPMLTGVGPDGAGVRISFTTASNVQYAVQGRENLLSGSWSNVLNSITGRGSIVTVTNAAPSAAGFYRIR
jgi:probable HAF family extracellular repeat protein